MTLSNLTMCRFVNFGLIASLVFVVSGCDRVAPQVAAKAFVPATDVTRPMVGKWGIDGEATLILELEGNQVVISAPENDTWRMDVLDAKIVGDEIHFTQKDYLHDGSSHPFNGVACNSIVKLLDDDSMEFGMTTVLTPDYEADVMVRME